jgi:hypothetical protein
MSDDGDILLARAKVNPLNVHNADSMAFSLYQAAAIAVEGSIWLPAWGGPEWKGLIGRREFAEELVSRIRNLPDHLSYHGMNLAEAAAFLRMAQCAVEAERGAPELRRSHLEMVAETVTGMDGVSR